MAKIFSFGGVASGQIFQLASVVPDIDESVQYSAEVLGVGPFTCSARAFTAKNGWYRGSTEMPKLTVAHGHNGRLFVEFIQQHDDVPSVYKEFIDKYGYGFHHYAIAIAPEEFDKTLNHYYDLGLEDIYTTKIYTGAQIKYIGPKTDTAFEKMRNEIGVGYLECVEVIDAEDVFFKSMYDAAQNWDGKTLFRD